jgi:hypothetical protein
MKRQTLPYWILAASLLTTASYLRADTTASGSLDLSSISAASDSGSISWDGTWSLNAIASANNSLGELDSPTDFGESLTATASAAVTWASSNVSATASGPSSVVGHVDGSVDLPGATATAASVGDEGNNVTLETTFSLDGTSSANVTFGAAINSLLQGAADANGQVLDDETVVNLQVDGSPVLFFDDSQTLNPGQTLYDLQTPTLTDTVNLASGSHDLFIELDTEQQALEVIPEMPNVTLLLGGTALLFAFMRRRVRWAF